MLLFCINGAIFAATPLRVVTELSPPHQTMQNGEVAGLSTALVKAVLTEAKLETQIEMYPWARSLRIARSRPNVLIYNMARTAQREAEFHWIGTVAAYHFGFVALSHRTDITIERLQDAKTLTIAVQRDDLSANFLMNNGFAIGQQLVLAADITESWQLLINGKVDLVIDDPAALADMAASLKLPQEYIRFVYAIPELAQQTWLAANIQTSAELVTRLKQAHHKVAATALYQQVMSSTYHPLQ
ncbi:substrate-binding periplasmic protein [Rheinheimera hassiensis]|uniref:substrate-binding periplasmic protein n=1 Tax=Rheinheimera hassiensis TaxID=1193627 RepID=UPI001F056A96|nr:transporter substrate-binding domain-containing protein [Rheinheimera hassiensis]